MGKGEEGYIVMYRQCSVGHVGCHGVNTTSV